MPGGADASPARMQPLAASAAKAVPVAFRKWRRSAITVEFPSPSAVPQSEHRRQCTRFAHGSEPSPQAEAEFAAVVGYRRDSRARPPQRGEIGRVRAAVEQVRHFEEQLQLAPARPQGIAGELVELRVSAGKRIEAEPVRPAER